jgi:hypothetical protein
MGFIAGSYRATWGGHPLGMVENGYTISYTKLGQNVTFDGLGATVIDTIYMGIDMSVIFTVTELDLQGVNDLLWDVPFAYSRGELGIPGLSESAYSTALTLNACNPSTNPNIAPTTITFFKAGVKNGHEIQVAFTNRHRKANIEMRIYPTRKTASFIRSCDFTYFEAT